MVLRWPWLGLTLLGVTAAACSGGNDAGPSLMRAESPDAAPVGYRRDAAADAGAGIIPDGDLFEAPDGSSTTRGDGGSPADPIPPCTVWVAPTGTDSGDGSDASPLRSIQAGVDQARPGDVVCVRGNGYSSARVAMHNSGSPDARIEVRALDDAVVRGFEIQADHITVRGFEVTTGGQDVGAGVFLAGQEIWIVDNYVHHLGEVGVECARNRIGETPRVTGALIKDNRIAYINGYGIWIEGENNIVQRNDVSRSFTDSNHDADGMRFFGRGHRILANYVHDIFESDSTTGPHSDCFQSYNAGTSPPLEDIVIESNVCSTDRHCVIVSNVSGPLTQQLTIRNNVCHSRIGSTGFFVGHDTGQDESIDGIAIVNNVVDLDSGFFAVYSDNSRNVRIQNNILVGSFAAWQGEGTLASRGFVERNNLTDGNPQFVDPDHPDARVRYRVGPDSPAIDSGSNEGVAETDADGRARIADGDGDGQATCDIGPYEL